MHDSPELSWVYWDKAIIIPMLITWKNNNIVHHDGVPICSVSTLLDLLINFSKYLEEYYWFKLKWEL